ncbi:MAG: BTAD domain-containing putative transcriptional regulator, partial [Omnitrophica WOR_2 bacterium]
MARLTLSFLGPFQVALDGNPVTGFVSNKVRALLAYLAVEANRPHSRESLCGLLWPDWPQSSALSSLRNCLADLRKNIQDQTAEPPFLLITREQIQFNRSSDYRLDLDEFEALSQGDDRSPAPIDELKKAISLYQGSFLEGFSLPDSNPFEEWLEAEREQAKRQMQSALQRLAGAYEQQDEYEQALVYAHRQLAMEPWLEEAHQRVMRLLARSGQRSAALAQFDICRTMLERELGVQPGDETLQLYEAIRDGKLETSRSFPITLSRAPAGTVTFVYIDIGDSAKLLERLRERYVVLLSEQRDLLQASYTRWNGHEIDAQDGVFYIVFTRASDAVACAIELQRTAAAHKWTEDACVRLRMGIHTGETIVTRTSYYGMDIYRAARIAAIGYGGQVLLSQTTRDLIDQALPEGTRLRDLGTHRIKEIRYPQQIYQLEIQGLPDEFPALLPASEADEPPESGEPPFKGLQFLEEGDADRFFGRSQVTARLGEAVCETSFLAVIGASGSGKSSVIRAGLVPALKRSPTPWHVDILTPTAHPLEALAIQLTRGSESVAAAEALIDDMAKDRRSLHLFLKENKPALLSSNPRGSFSDTKTLLVVDQFEELFTLCRDEDERTAFIENLLYAAFTGDQQAHILIALRADFYAHLAQYAQLRQAVASRQEYLGAMNAGELRQAIEEPARLGGWEYSPGLVELILHEIGADAGRQPEPGALPLLSHALLETWKRRRGNCMTLKAYVESGGVRRAIARTAENLVSRELSPRQQEIARNIFLRLTESGEGDGAFPSPDTRRRAALSELVPPPQFGGSTEVEEVLNRLVEARLITLGEGTAEVAHEALIREWPTLREWLDQNREGLRILHHLAETVQEWEHLGHDPGILYRGARLAQVMEWAQANPPQLSAREQAFLEASREAAEREQAEQENQRRRELAAAQKLAEAESLRAEEQSRAARRLRQRAIYLSLALGAAFILIVVAILFSRQSTVNLEAARTAGAQANIQRVTAVAAGDQAISEAHTRATAEVQAMQQAELARVREWTTAAVSNLTTDPELSILLALQAVQTRDIPETENALHQAVQAFRLRDTLNIESRPYGVAFDPSGSRIATASQDGAIRIWDMDENGLKVDPTPVLTLSNPLDYLVYSSYNVSFSPDGKQLAAVSAEYTVKIWDSTNGELLRSLKGHTSYLTSLTFSPDGKLLATGSADHTVSIWDIYTGELLQTLYGFQEAVYMVTFSRDGKHLAAGGAEGSVIIWDQREITSADTGGKLYNLDFSIQEKMGGYSIQAMDFSPDGKQLALSISWGIKIYDISAASPAKLLQSITT